MSDIPDPGDDFEGCIDALTKQAIAEHDSIPEAERPVFYFRKALEHLENLFRLDAPDILIRMAFDGLEKKLPEMRAKYPPAPHMEVNDDDAI